MYVFIYIRQIHASDSLLINEIKKMFSDGNIKIYKNLENLENGIIRTLCKFKIVILFCRNEDELDCFISHNGFLHSVIVILLLPNQKPLTIHKGFKLFPRFMSDIDGNLIEVVSVLKKIKSSSFNKTD